MCKSSDWQAGLSHQFAEELALILKHCDQVLKNLPAGSPVSECLVRIQEAAERGVGISRSLYSQTVADDTASSGIALDVCAAVQSMEPTIKRIAGDSVHVILLAHRTPARVFLPKGRLEQILLALAQNACDAMPDGGSMIVETSIVRVEDDQRFEGYDVSPGEYVVVAISDTGRGMDEETRRRLCEPFFSSNRGAGVPGLGMTMVDTVVRTLGGYITVESEPGSGARVAVHLPRLDVTSVATGTIRQGESDVRDRSPRRQVAR